MMNAPVWFKGRVPIILVVLTKLTLLITLWDKPVKMQHVHTAGGKAMQTALYTYNYDHAGRLLTTKHKPNASAETLLVINSFDELIHLQSNSQTCRNPNPNLKTDYVYNVRSWMKTISNPLFNETLYYQDAPTNVSRYKANYNESSFYDLLGNLTAIQRFRRTRIGAFGLIDNLTMNYICNQLIKAENAVSTSNFSNQGDFRNEVSKTVEYEYDKNGNMTKDFNKGIDTISYNSLNLPISLSIKNSLGSATNNYTYSANGKKLKVEMKFGNQTKAMDYVGNMIYENGALKRILVDGGYVENGQYHFYIQDHLGNNRVVAKADGTVIQTNHYYPYGMTFMEDNIGDPKAQPYKYGGKEFDGERGLNLYDYLARSMDAVEGRFTSVDPLCEKKPWTSPYVYCSNNPVNRIDPDGKIDIDKNTQKKYPELTKYLKELSKEWKGKSESFKTAFMEKSGLNEKQVKQMLIFGQGPKLEVVKDLKNNKGVPVNGLTDAFLVKSTSKLINSNNGKGFIKLDKQVVDMLENAKTNDAKESAKIMVESTTFHEMTHVGNVKVNGSFNGNFAESGQAFEKDAYGQGIETYNVEKYWRSIQSVEPVK